MTMRLQHSGGAGFRKLGCLLALIVSTGSGCNPKLESYDPKQKYDLRTDPIVLSSPAATPIKDDLPKHGKINEFLAGLPARGGAILDPKAIPEPQREELNRLLESRFGTPSAPANPTVEPELGLNPETLAKGSASYRVRCTQCHGIAGDARGPTGPWIFPYPRDFRSGQFKRTAAPGKPTLDDLVHNLRAGVPGTSMPMFDLLPPDDLRALAAYVVHLSIRGEVELRLMKELLSEEGDAGDLPRAFDREYSRVLGTWKQAQGLASPRIELGESNEARIRKGHALFTSSGCIGCHANYGNTESFRYDIWGFPNSVTNLRQPERKWGAEPHDLARTVRNGIPPANMPAVPLNDADLAELVHFLRALPYPAQLPPDVRATVEGAR
jgi:mono/diheme cytochrome c family protein